MKTLATFLLIMSFLFASTPLTKAQTALPQRFEAEMLITKPADKSPETVPIDILIEDKWIRFEATGTDVSKSKSFENAYITSAEHTYSKKPRFATGARIALAATVFLLPVMFAKTKQHWMTVNVDDNFAVLKLKKSNYRMLLSAMRAKGINVIDSGNQNKKVDEKKDKTGK
jgi:hypothetical protein